MMLMVCILLSVQTAWSEVDLVQLSEDIGLTTFVDLIHKAGLEEMLSFGTKGQFTMFGPTNEAFAALPPGTLNMLKNNMDMLDTVIRYHVYMGSEWTSMMYNDEEEPSLDGDYYTLRLNKYEHNKTVTVCGSHIIHPNYNGTNGILHVIKDVLYPLPDGNIVGNLTVREPRLQQLAKLINRTTLNSTINSDPVTFFAPTNDAFSKLPPSTWAFLMKNTTALEEVLKYHIVQGSYYKLGLETVRSLKTLEGGHVNITVFPGNTAVNKAKITEADVKVSNGVVHFIDTLLFPSSGNK